MYYHWKLLLIDVTCSVLAAIVIEAYNKFFLDSEKDNTDHGDKTIKEKLVNAQATICAQNFSFINFFQNIYTAIFVGMV